jgi:hypothetical protein
MSVVVVTLTGTALTLVGRALTVVLCVLNMSCCKGVRAGRSPPGACRLLRPVGIFNPVVASAVTGTLCGTQQTFQT